MVHSSWVTLKSRSKTVGVAAKGNSIMSQGSSSKQAGELM